MRPIVRPYRPEDRAAIRKICADTGFLGQPIDPVFEDRELFADYLTAYYTDEEPELTFVCELEGEVKGYIMGSRFPKKKARYEARMMPGLVLRGLWHCLTWPYHAASRRYIWWILTQARKEVPFTPPNMAHFHFNVLAEARSVPACRDLVDSELKYLAAQGEKQVYGHVVATDTRRGDRMFARYGFKVVDTREVTKYRAFHPGKIQLLTVVKDLELNPVLYGADLHRMGEQGVAE
jgi:predicted N-acetyltransferase YhbS